MKYKVLIYQLGYSKESIFPEIQKSLGSESESNEFHFMTSDCIYKYLLILSCQPENPTNRNNLDILSDGKRVDNPGNKTIFFV